MKIDFNKAQFLTCADALKDFPPPTVAEIAFLGRSNVGKSSLINRLTRRRHLAKTSSTPGKTQTIVFFDLDDQLRLVDLPGCGYAAVNLTVRRHWQTLAEDYFSSRKVLRGAVVIMDIRHAPTPIDFELFTWLKAYQIVLIPVLNKADKLPRNKQIQRLREVKAELKLDNGEEIILFSAEKGLGVEALETAVKNAAFPMT